MQIGCVHIWPPKYTTLSIKDIQIAPNGSGITDIEGGVDITVADAENKVGLTITQNDVTNNPNALSITNAGSGKDLQIENTMSGGFGVEVDLYHNSASPADFDESNILFSFKDDASNKTTFAKITAFADDVSNGTEDGSLSFSTIRNGVLTNTLLIDSSVNGIKVGSSAVGAGVVSSNGNQDLILRTGNATTGNITITDGASGNIGLNPNGTGRVQANAVNIPTVSSTDTFTNKRITKRVTSETSSATPTVNSDNTDIHRITALALAITNMSTNLTGTPTHGQTLIYEITGTAARAITWGTSFEASTVALPTTTVTTAMLMVGFSWNSATSKWRCIAVA
jgi:hypothetical protein